MTAISDPKVRAALSAAKRQLRAAEGVHGVDYGFAYTGGQMTNRPSIRVHVRRKLPLDMLAEERRLPDDVHGLELDVLECGYRPHGGDPRAQQAVLSPGLSIGNLRTSETGTLGAFVRDLAGGDIYVLSNWHVLAGDPSAGAGDVITQPGPMHLGPNPARGVALLARTLALTEQYDAALASLDVGMATNTQLFNTDFDPTKVKAPALGAVLVKSGAVSGVTRAVVDGVSGAYQLNYAPFGLGVFWMQGFRLVKDPADPAASISEQGDSGSLWVDPSDDSAVGLHFAGEDDSGPLNDYALAHPLGDVLQRLNVQLIT